MINPRLIKKRVNSVKNIGKITKALEMVSASKVQKLTQKALNAKPYARLIYELVGNLAGDSELLEIPLMRQPETENNALYILISTNRGLAGSLNTNLFRKLNMHLELKNSKKHLITIGKKGRSFALLNGNLVADFSDYKEKTDIVSSVSKILIEGFVDGIYDSVYIVYNDFITALSQEPSVKKILPIKREELSEEKPGTLEISGESGAVKGESIKKRKSFHYEPDPVAVLENLLPYYLEIQLVESLYEAEASEHASRMIAMKNASDNSEELSFSLSLEYNKGRQSLITTEISDITTAQVSIAR